MDIPDSTIPREGPRAKSRTQSQDASIMGTNSSSIVSKRSVERLYFPDEAHFFRYFVKKPQRRAPLINRGYWLRMKAIDQTVRRFLEKPSPKKKVVVNLGCGYDPLPWQCTTRYPASCKGVIFIDIDYRDLMLKKRAVVRDVHQLNSILTGTEESEGDVLLRSDQYLQVGCDLRDVSRLGNILSTIIDIHGCRILFTAEVSITYMGVESADALIKFCSTLPDACFCLLEQILPDGLDHPFSRTMMAHFDKLQTPIHAVRKYPTVSAQRLRFLDLGWSDVHVRNLWELWSSSDVITSQERKDLDFIEPFDEWEEFSLFAGHYFLLQASKMEETQLDLTIQEVSQPEESHPEESHPEESHPEESQSEEALKPLSEIRITFSENPKAKGCRRFAATMPTRSQNPAQDMLAVFGGMGLASRVNSYDEYQFADQPNHVAYYPGSPLVIPNSRMCHTITDLGDTGALLVGGRTSPDSGLVDCWLYHKWLNIWERVDDLPWPLYRHQATMIDQHHVLVSTGRINSQIISDKFLVWSRRGWFKCSYGSDSLIPVAAYGSVFTKYPSGSLNTGVFAGGISSNGVVLNQTLSWVLTNVSSAEPNISFQASKHSKLLCRFGASIITHCNKIFLIGGIIKDRVLRSAEEISYLEIQVNHQHCITPISLKLSPMIPRPILVGTSAFSTENSLVLLGGSAVCFSFGTYWNQGIYVMTLSDPEVLVKQVPSLLSMVGMCRAPIWKFSRTICTKPLSVNPKPMDSSIAIHKKMTSAVPRVQSRSNVDLTQFLRGNKPIIFENLDIGSCTSTWTLDYLKQYVGFNREVTVHESTTKHMDFTTKNFIYKPKQFGDFIDGIEGGGKMYLRSLSSDQPSLSPAIFARDFPTIAADFHVPPELSLVSENAHSSPLRISGPVIMWLHYDVMANVLCQIRGTKRLLLYPPSDFKHFGFEPGASSSPTNVFDNPSPAGSHPHEAILNPGDILFIPSLWLHSAFPTSGVSIAVNVFFRDLKNGYAAGKDVYGNRDLQAYEKGRQELARILRSFDNIPGETRSFYLERLAEELKLNAS